MKYPKCKLCPICPPPHSLIIIILITRQVQFIDGIASSLYKLLADFWPDLEPFYLGCIQNKNKWSSLIKE